MDIYFAVCYIDYEELRFLLPIQSFKRSTREARHGHFQNISQAPYNPRFTLYAALRRIMPPLESAVIKFQHCRKSLQKGAQVAEMNYSHLSYAEQLEPMMDIKCSTIISPQ